MGTETKLYVSSKWELYDVKTVIESHLGYSVKIQSNHKINANFFYFFLTKKGKQPRMISIFTSSETPIGFVTELRLGYNEESIEILTKIADVLGGYLIEKDTHNILKEFYGMFHQDYGIPFYYKNAVLHNEISDDEDINGLSESMKELKKKGKK